VSYLKNVNKPMSHDLLVLHYLQQSKFTDAIQLEAVSSATTVSVLNIISGAGQMRIVEIFLRYKFLLRDAMQAWPMPSCGVCLSVTFVTSVKTNKHIFSPSGSYTILVFSYQVSWQYSDGDPP